MLGPDVKEELPVLYLRLRDAVEHGSTRLVEFAVERQRMTGLTMDRQGGAVAAFELPADFSEELSGTKNYRAFQIGISFGWTWGKGHPPQP